MNEANNQSMETIRMSEMKQNRAIARSTVSLFLLSVVSPFCGMLLEITFAWAFGASPLMDAYRIAALILVFGMQFFFGQLIVGVIIPLIAEYRAKRLDEEAWQTCFTIAFLISVFMLPLVICIVVHPEILQRMLAPGLNTETAQQAQFLIKFFVFAFFIFVWTGAMNGLLQAYQVFWVQPVAQAIVNICFIFIIASIGRDKGVHGLIFGVLSGACISFCLYLWSVWRVSSKNNIHLSACIHFRLSPPLKTAFKLAIPVLGLIIATQWYLVVINRILSEFDAGTLANFGYALKLRLLGSLLPISFATVLFPSFANFVANGNWSTLQNIADRGLRYMIFISVPIAALVLIMRVPLAAVIFQRGMLGEENIRQIAALLLPLFSVLPVVALNQLLFKLSFSVKNTIAPFFQQLIVAVGITIFAPFFAIYWGAQGVIFTYSVLMWISVLMLAVYLQKRYIFWRTAVFFSFFWRFGLAISVFLTLASLVDSLFSYFIKPNFFGYILQIFGVTSIAGFVLFFVSNKLNIDEAKEIWNWIKFKIIRNNQTLYNFINGLNH